MPRRSLVLLGVVVCLATSACSVPGFLVVERPPDGITVKALTADISFGEGPPVNDAIAALVPPAGLVLTLLPDLYDLDGLAPLAFTPGAPVSPCPKPSETTFPEKSAGFVVEGTAQPGTYRWKQSGSIEIVGLAKLNVNGLDVRRIRSLPSTTQGVFAYEYEQASLAGREIQTIEVRQSGNAQTHGVFLRRFQLITSKGTVDFNPPPLLAPKLYSLPIRTEVVSATGIDPVSGLSVTINGNVDATQRVRLEGCGEVFDAWAFKGSRVVQSISEPEQAIRSTTYDTFLAPQHGGVFVGDHVVTRGSFGPIQYTSDLTGTLGTLQPVGRP